MRMDKVCKLTSDPEYTRRVRQACIDSNEKRKRTDGVHIADRLSRVGRA